MRAATPTDAKACWESMGAAASCRRVAEKLAAAGLRASFKSVALWKREGWPGADDPGAAADRAVASATAALEPVVAMVTGNPAVKVADVLPADEDAPPDVLDPDTAGDNSTVTERALRRLILGAEALTESIVGNINVLSLTPETAARSLVAITAAIRGAADGLARIPAMREGEMKPSGGVEILPPKPDGIRIASKEQQLLALDRQLVKTEGAGGNIAPLIAMAARITGTDGRQPETETPEEQDLSDDELDVRIAAAAAKLAELGIETGSAPRPGAADSGAGAPEDPEQARDPVPG